MSSTNSQQEDPKVKLGAREFQTNKDAMLDLFELAKIQSKSRPTQTDKGRVAESALREWLTQFLPKRYAVTSGYIISQGIHTANKLLHYDVIIYDALNAPVLWVEKNADHSEQGKVRAIPAEYTCCVLEIKSSFNDKSCTDAKDKLWELAPLLKNIDDPQERYKRYLPTNFYMGIVFFEILESEKSNLKALEKLIPSRTTADLRGYFGGVILQAEGRDRNLTGKINFTIGDSELPVHGDLTQSAMTGNVKTPDGKYFGAMIGWTPVYFAMFAFDLVAMMNGTYNNRLVSSFHGMPFGVNDGK